VVHEVCSLKTEVQSRDVLADMRRCTFSLRARLIILCARPARQALCAPSTSIPAMASDLAEI
jgi:hypothetical protein